MGNCIPEDKEDEQSQLTLYTTRRCRKNGDLYGKTHGSMDGGKTVCGEDMDEKWWILTNAFDGRVTCKRCLDVINTPLTEDNLLRLIFKRARNG